MALIKFTAKAFTEPHEGLFEAKFKGVREAVSKKGNQFFWFDFKTEEGWELSKVIMDNGYGRRDFDNLLRAFGYEPVDEVDTDILVGMDVRIEVVKEDRNFAIEAFRPSEKNNEENVENENSDEEIVDSGDNTTDENMAEVEAQLEEGVEF